MGGAAVVAVGAPPKKGQGVAAAEKRPGSSTPPSGTPLDKVSEAQHSVREHLEPRTQDSCSGEVHLDVVMHDGRCVQRLREREDFPGFFEGLFNFAEEDVGTLVR